MFITHGLLMVYTTYSTGSVSGEVNYDMVERGV